MIEKKLAARLSTLAPNLYPLKAPKNYRTPCVIYNVLHTDPIRDLDRGVAPLCAYIVQVDVYDPRYVAANTLAKSIRDDLVEWSDDGVQAVDWTGQTNMIDDTTDIEIYRTMMTFLIFADPR